MNDTWVWVIVGIVCFLAILVAVVHQLVEDEKTASEAGVSLELVEDEKTASGAGVSLDFFHDIESGEINLTRTAIGALSEANVCPELIQVFGDDKSFRNPENRGYMFEARFAYELLSAPVGFEYEYAAGVGNSTIDFRLKSRPAWSVELVGGRLSDKAWAATEVQHHGGITTASQEMQDPHETWRLINRILSKASKDGEPWKFPLPTSDVYHMVVIDDRSYLATADKVDYMEIVYGVRGLPKGWPPELIKSNPNDGKPIGGLFDDTNTTPGAEHFRERVHFVVFVREKYFVSGEISSHLRPFANWDFFDT